MNLLRDDPNYTRLPGGGRTPTGKTSFWLAPDHLLIVEVQFTTESYRRFDLREIQAVTLSTTRHRFWVNLGIFALGLVLCVPGCVVLFAPAQDAGAELVATLSLGVPLGLMAAALLVNSLLGPTCRVELQTAVQTIPLPSLTRWRKAEKLLAALAPAVQAAQSSLSKPTDSIPPPEAPLSAGPPLSSD